MDSPCFFCAFVSQQLNRALSQRPPQRPRSPPNRHFLLLWYFPVVLTLDLENSLLNFFSVTRELVDGVSEFGQEVETRRREDEEVEDVEDAEDMTDIVNDCC